MPYKQEERSFLPQTIPISLQLRKIFFINPTVTDEDGITFWLVKRLKNFKGPLRQKEADLRLIKLVTG
jgi:hypothetical protein